MLETELAYLYAERLRLRLKLEWIEANSLSAEADFANEADLREQIGEQATEIATLERRLHQPH